MNWTSPTTSTVVGSSHSRGPSGVLPGLCSGVRRILLALVKALALDAPLADASALVGGMDQRVPEVLSCRPARCGPSESCRVFAPSCRELRTPESGGCVMFGESCLDHRSEPITGTNDER
jgi:hypothetical protein